MSETLGRYNVLFEIITKQQGDINQIKQEASGLQNVFKAAGIAFAGIISAQAVKQVVGRIFEVTKKYQKYNTILKVALGSQREAAKAMKLIEDTASGTIFSVDELTASYIKFVNRGVNPTKEEIIALADLAASQGKSFDQLTEAVLDAQTGEFERLKEFGIKANKEGDTIRLAFKGMNKEIKNTPESISEAIYEFGRMDGVMGSNIKQMEDMEGLVSNIGDSSEKFIKNIGERMKSSFTASLNLVKSLVEKFVEWTNVPLEEKLEEEQVALNVLVSEITDANTEQEKRNLLIGTLQDEYPDFLKNMDAEKVTNTELRDRLSEVNNQYVLRIVLAKRTAIIDKKKNKLAEEEETLATIRIRQRKKLFELDAKYGTTFLSDAKGLDDALKKLNEYRQTTKEFPAGFALDAAGIFSIKKGSTKRAITSFKDEIDRIAEETELIKKDLIERLGLDDLEFLEVKVKVKIEPDEEEGETKEQKKARLKREEAAKKRELALTTAFIEQNFELLQNQARREISDKLKLNKALQQLELEKQLGILSIQKDFLDKTDVNYKLEVDKIDLQIKKIEGILNGLSRIELISPLKKFSDDIDSDLENISYAINELVSLGKLGKIDVETQKYLEKLSQFLTDVDDEYEKHLEIQEENILDMMAKTLKESEKFYFPEKEDEKPFIQRLLGVDDETYKEIEKGYFAVRDLIDQVYSGEIQKIDDLIGKQEERVSKAEELAEKGKVKQLQIEEERLNALNAKREKYVKQQNALSQAEIIAANAVAAAESIKAISKAFASGAGVTGIISGIATGIALAAQIGSIIYAVNNSFSDLPSFYKGIERTGSGNVDNKNGFLAINHPNERIVNASDNQKIGYDFPNSKLGEAVDLYRNYPRLKYEINNTKASNTKEFTELKKEIAGLKTSIESINITTKLDRAGFTQGIERDIEDVRRRIQIMG